MALPMIIQGGMGVAISSWQLANVVSQLGQLGVVSGTGIGLILAAKLQEGDPGGHVRRALSHFPFQESVQRIMDTYFVEGGVGDKPYKRPPMWTLTPPKSLNEITVVANFVEVFLAKEGHNNPVGINLLEKVQLPNISSLYGAMLAGVDFVIMGAGIVIQIPGVLDKLAEHQDVSYRIDVLGTDAGEEYRIHFSPQEAFPGLAEKLGNIKRPMFLPIISSLVLAKALLQRSTGELNGFVIETPIAGGHNAPPRGKLQLNERGEPLYGPKDEIDIAAIRDIGLPFWLAGGYGSPEGLLEALDAGAQGIQVGTAFAYSDESGMVADAKTRILQKVLDEEASVFTDARISPTGYPFKVAQLEGSVSEKTVYEARNRICDIGYLRHLYRREDGKIGYRCPSEPENDYVRKGGDIADCEGRGCLCNNLGAAAGYGQRRENGYIEPPAITSGDALPGIIQFLQSGKTHYSAQDVITHLTSKLPK